MGGSALWRDGGRPSNGTVQGAIHYPSQSTILASASLSSRLRSAREAVVYFVLCPGSCGWSSLDLGRVPVFVSSVENHSLSNAGNLVICDVIVISASEKYDENIVVGIL